MRKLIILLIMPLLIAGCGGQQMKNNETKEMPVTKPVVEKTMNVLIDKYGQQQKFRIERGVNQVAQLGAIATELQDSLNSVQITLSLTKQN